MSNIQLCEVRRLELGIIKFKVFTTFLHQFCMRAILFYPVFSEHYNSFGIPDGGHPVRNDKSGSVFGQLIYP